MITWQHPGRPVILASQSPRRKEILARMGYTFTKVRPEAVDEKTLVEPADLDGSLAACALAKARSVAVTHAGALVLGADTVVVKGRRVLGKPGSRSEARAMLRSLSGSRHAVLTGVALVCGACAFSAAAVARTDVFFRRLPIDEIEAYLDLGEYCDKAGAYAIQGRAMTFVDAIDGCYYNVVGLPVAETIALFTKYISAQRRRA